MRALHPVHPMHPMHPMRVVALLYAGAGRGAYGRCLRWSGKGRQRTKRGVPMASSLTFHFARPHRERPRRRVAPVWWSTPIQGPSGAPAATAERARAITAPDEDSAWRVEPFSSMEAWSVPVGDWDMRMVCMGVRLRLGVVCRRCIASG